MSLTHNDLSGTILPVISLDEFNPKAGKTEEVIVVAFYAHDQEPADDLNTFIQRGVIDTLDVDVSPSTDDEGRYLIFVEMGRDHTFPEKFKALIKDIENVTGKQEWKVRTYLSNDKEFDYTDPAIYKYVITEPDEYVTKDDFMKESIQADVREFLKNSGVVHLTVNENTVTMSAGINKIMTEVVDVGDYDAVIGRNFLKESAFDMGSRSMELRVLSSILGNYSVTQLGNLLCVGNTDDDKIMLLKNTEIKYRG